ncbi:MAG: hypothetical protein VCB25_10150, partial [Myxococcota bacterium]
MKSARTVAVFAALAIGPLYFTLAGSFAGPEGSTHQLTYDTYGYFYPNILHASRSFLEGAGLFWNPYQNCGQPFFAFSLTGLLYPVNFVFFVLERDSALLASAAMNLVLGGLGTWLLLREYRLSVPASLCGALAFQLSAPVLELGSWSPMHSGAIVWMPWAMFCLERILRRPSIHHGIALAVVLAVQTLPGFPQIPLFTLQLMALRLVWAVLGGQVPEWRQLTVPLLIGFGSVPFLVAAQYLPALEVAAESVRASGVDPGSVTLEGFPVGYFPGVLAAMLAAAGWVMRRNRALIAFYLVAAVIFLLLSRGPDNFLFELYADMPLGDLFIRRPKRFLWVSNFAFAVLVAFGVDSLRDASESWRLKLTSLAAMLGCLIALNAVMPSGLATSAWLIGGLALAVVAYGHSLLPGRTLTPWLIIVGLGVTSLWATSILVPREPDLYDRHAGLLEPLSHRLTAQDRVFLSARSLDFPFIEKLSSIYAIPG